MADLRILEKQIPVPSAEPAQAPPPVRLAPVVKHLTMMMALASQTRLAAFELCLDWIVFHGNCAANAHADSGVPDLGSHDDPLAGNPRN